MKRIIVGLMFGLNSLIANADWPILPAGEVICDNWSSAMEQAHYFMQGIDELADKKSCGRLKADTEYVVIGASFIRDEEGNAVKGIPSIRIKKNSMKAFHIPRGEK